MEQPLCGQPVVEVCSDHVGFACIFVGGGSGPLSSAYGEVAFRCSVGWRSVAIGFVFVQDRGYPLGPEVVESQVGFCIIFLSLQLL